MSVATKKITNKLLDLSIKSNFESVKDGTAKPLEDMIAGASSFLDNTFGSIGGIISNISNKVSGTVNKIMKTVQTGKKLVQGFKNNIKGFVNKVVTNVKGLIKNGISGIVKKLGIPIEKIKGLVKKAVGFVKKAISNIGGFIKEKLKIIKDIKDGVMNLMGMTVGAIVGHSMIASIISSFKDHRDGLKKIVDKFVNELGVSPVEKALRMLIHTPLDSRKKVDGSAFKKYYYEVYGTLKDYIKDENKSKIFNSTISTSIRRGIVKTGFIGGEGSVFKKYKWMGFDSKSNKDIIELSRANDLDRIIRPNIPRVDTSVMYSEGSRRTELSEEEKLRIIRIASGLTNRNRKVKDKSVDGIMNTYIDNKRVKEYSNKRNITIVNCCKNIDINKPLDIKTGRTNTVTAKKDGDELDRISSMVGNGVKVDGLGYGEFNGYSKKISVSTSDTKKTIVPSVGRELIFKI